ncbi:MAG: hypothetical protein ACLRNQ_18595 [Flavonifractor plautii]
MPYAREIEDMELMQTLGVDRAGEGQVEVTASSGSGDPAEGAATVVSGQAGTISAAVLGMQGRAPPTSTSATWASSCWERSWPGREWSPPWTIFSGMWRPGWTPPSIWCGAAQQARRSQQRGRTAPPLTGWRRWRRTRVCWPVPCPAP